MNTSANLVKVNGHAQHSCCDADQGPAVDQPRITPRYPWYAPCKVWAEALAALVLLIPALPIIAVAAVCVKLTSRGPIFYTQTRLGENGRPFKIFKLRTMINNAEAKTGAVWCQANDPRITAVGNWLRELHIDELPQLFNVLLGQMSLVGPRPERPEFINALEWEIPAYRQRLRVRPGVTGLAQLNLPPDSDIESVRKKLIHDLYYIRHASPWLDGKIVFFTAWLLLTSCLGRAARLFCLPSHVEVNSRFEEFFEDEAPESLIKRA
jgi:lipopolysaccharide/colanic/teichoic acid biosynthesis glycosyltransferase